MTVMENTIKDDSYRRYRETRIVEYMPREEFVFYHNNVGDTLICFFMKEIILEFKCSDEWDDIEKRLDEVKTKPRLEGCDASEEFKQKSQDAISDLLSRFIMPPDYAERLKEFQASII